MIRQLLLLLLKLGIISCVDKGTEDLLTPLRLMGETCGYASCPLLQKDMLNVHIVPHTHGELGDTRTFFEHYTGHDNFYEKSQINMKRILDYTISELWARPDRKFTLSDMPYLFHWWANRDETVRRMVYQLLRQGRLYLVGGGWSMSDEATTSYHAVIDHFTYSLRKINATFMECGRPLVAWQADCFGHSREFASLLSQMGFDGLFINPISFDDELERMKRKGLEFMWRGSDDLGADSDIYTHKLFDGYWSPPGFCFGGQCSDPLIITSSEDFSNVKERLSLFIKSVQFRQSPYYTTRNVMVVMGQRWGYYDASVWFANIDKLITLTNQHSVMNGLPINVFYSTPACYLKAVHEENPKLQTKQDDFFPVAYDKSSYATGLYTSRPSLKYMAREGHKFLHITKQLHVNARLGNYNKFFEDMSWINGVFQDHNIISGALRSHVMNYYVTKMTKNLNTAVGTLIKDGFNKLRKSPEDTNYYKCKLNISSCIHSSGSHFFVVVYNPLSWNVSIPVRLPIQPISYSVYNPQGKTIKAAMIPISPHIVKHPDRKTLGFFELLFYADNIPPMGFRSYCIQKTYLGWERPKRSLIKKINQKKPKKYLVRQTNSANEENLFEDNEPDSIEFEYLSTTPKYETKIVFGNVSRNDYETRFTGVLTPKSRIETSTRVATTTTTVASTSSATSSTEVPSTSTTETAKMTEATTRPTTRTVTEKTKEEDEGIDEVNFDKDLNTIVFPKGYAATRSAKPYFNNKYIRVNLDKDNRIREILLANGIKMSLSIKFFYYVSDDPAKLNKKMSAPGAYIFRAMDNQQEEIKDKIDACIYKTRLHREYHCKLADYVSYSVRLYANSSVLEVDWVVGPISVEDGLGKDIFIKYTTNLENNGVFYTDANGRQTMKRIRNMRPTFEPLNPDQIAGNFYPVTSKIYIEDTKSNIRFAVLNDRAQGGSSLRDGEIDIMLHRRILTDDSGVQAYLNETEFENGIMVRGTHYLYISKADHKPTRVFEKKLAKEIELKPQIFNSNIYGYGRQTKKIWLKQNNEFSALKSKLPLGIHILTLETWTEDTFLLRLENFLEQSDAVLSGVKTVQLNGLFKRFNIKKIKETTLAGNIWLKDYVPLGWNKDKFLRNFNDAYGSGSYEYTDSIKSDIEEVDLNKGIVLRPQQIRTFVVWYDFVK